MDLKIVVSKQKSIALRKYAYSNILKILPQKEGKFSDKKSDIFHIPAQNIHVDCGYLLELPWQGGSNEYPNLCYCSKIRKIMYIPVNRVL